jgi:hypothetical protein
MYSYTGDAIPRMLTTIVTTGGLASHKRGYDQHRSNGCGAAAAQKKSRDRTRQPLVDGCPAREEEMSLVCYLMVEDVISDVTPRFLFSPFWFRLSSPLAGFPRIPPGETAPGRRTNHSSNFGANR